MKDTIAQAYLAEQKYIASDHQGRQLVDILADFGYTLDEYFEDKKEFLLRTHPTYIELLDNQSLDDIFEKVTGSMYTKQQACYLSYNNDLFAWTGSDDFDDDKAKTYNMKVHKMSYIGGTMIIDQPDISGAICIPNTYDIHFDYFVQRFQQFLINKGATNVVIDNNDILINDRKVFGGASYHTDDMYVFLFVATFSDHLDIIKEFCPINEAKIPGYITVTNSQEMREEILTWLSDI